MMSQDAVDENVRGVADHYKVTNTPEQTKGSHETATAQILAGGYTKGLYMITHNCGIFKIIPGTLFLLFALKG